LNGSGRGEALDFQWLFWQSQTERRAGRMSNNAKRQKQDLVAIGLLTLLSTGILFIGIFPLGMGVEYDSIFYLNAAEKIARGEELKLFNQFYYSAWPPLYPASIALFSKIGGIDPFNASLYLHVLLHGLLTAFIGYFLFANLQDKSIAVLGFLTLAVSPVIISFSSLVYSELLFMAATLPFFLFFKNPSDDKWIWIAVLVGIIVSLTRYIGISLIMAMASFFLLKKVKIRKILFFALLSSLPLGLWLLRNYLLVGRLAGNRALSRTPFLVNVKLFIQALVNWCSAFSWKALGVIILMALILGLFLMIKKEKRFLPSMEPVIIFMLVYSFFLLFAFFFIALPRIQDRFMFPLYIPLFFLMFIVIDHWLKRDQRLKPWIIIVLLLFLTDNALSSFRRIQEWKKDGRTAATQLYHSPLTPFLKDHDFDGKIISNKPHLVYFLSKKISTFSPWKTARDADRDLFQVRNALRKTGKIYLVWFRDPFGPAYSLEELRAHFDLSPIREFKKASIFQITRRGG
jgi:hypothetical protein